MKFKKTIPIALVIAILISVIAISSGKARKTVETIASTDSAATEDKAKSDSEMRGVWISYIELSMENEEDKSEGAFYKKFETIALCSKENGFNTLIVQVRPFCDALYKSKYFPWSHILSGTQGKNPGYDPLKIMCEICRNNELAIHAWINPYRIATSDTPKKLNQNNPYSKNTSIGFETESGTYLYPSDSVAQNLIINGVAEIVENYDIDAIQFDDYFYPEDIGNKDSDQYKEYVNSVGSENAMSLDNWRIANVNQLICDVYRKIHSIKNYVEFGISPQGNMKNNRKIYADVKSWCTCRGFVDYICPQIYFSLDNPELGFEEALKEWCALEYSENVKLYVGLAGYKAGTDDDKNTWSNSNDILKKEYEIICGNEKAEGFMLYSYSCLNESYASTEIKNLTENLNKLALAVYI